MKGSVLVLAGLLSLFMLIATPVASLSTVIPAFCQVTPPNSVDPANVELPGTWVGKDGIHVGVPIDGVYYAKTEPGSEGVWN